MRLHFLCPVHRDWVHFNPDDAFAHLEGAQNTGEQLMLQNQWKQALSHLGCAFESVEILLDLYGSENVDLVTRLTSLAILMEGCFKRLGSDDYALALVKQARDRLQAAADVSLGNKPKLAFLQQCIWALKQEPVVSQRYKGWHEYPVSEHRH